MKILICLADSKDSGYQFEFEFPYFSLPFCELFNCFKNHIHVSLIDSFSEQAIHDLPLDVSCCLTSGEEQHISCFDINSSECSNFTITVSED